MRHTVAAGLKEMESKAFMPGHYYKGAYGLVVKVVRRSATGKTVYLTTHGDFDDAYTFAKRIQTDESGYEFIKAKDGFHIICVENEVERDRFISYIQKHIGEPIATF